MLSEYLLAVMRRAFALQVRWTDALQILAASAVPLASHFFGASMPEGTSNVVLAYIGLAAITFFLIRIVTAPYLLWKEERTRAEKAESQLVAPTRQRRERLCAELLDSLSMLRTLVSQLPRGSLAQDAIEHEFGNQYAAKASEVRYHLQRLFDQAEIFGEGNNNLHLCNVVLDDKRNARDTREWERELDDSTRRLHDLVRSVDLTDHSSVKRTA